MIENKKIINFKLYSHYNILIYVHSSLIMGKCNYYFIVTTYKLPVKEETKEAQYWKIIISRITEKIKIGEVL